MGSDVAEVEVDGWTVDVQVDVTRVPGIPDALDPAVEVDWLEQHLPPEPDTVIVATSVLGEECRFSPSYTAEELVVVLAEQNTLLEHLDGKHTSWAGGCPECERERKGTA